MQHLTPKNALKIVALETDRKKPTKSLIDPAHRLDSATYWLFC